MMRMLLLAAAVALPGTARAVCLGNDIDCLVDERMDEKLGIPLSDIRNELTGLESEVDSLSYRLSLLDAEVHHRRLPPPPKHYEPSKPTQAEKDAAMKRFEEELEKTRRDMGLPTAKP